MLRHTWLLTRSSQPTEKHSPIEVMAWMERTMTQGKPRATILRVARVLGEAVSNMADDDFSFRFLEDLNLPLETSEDVDAQLAVF